jgi:hypothetical protein
VMKVLLALASFLIAALWWITASPHQIQNGYQLETETHDGRTTYTLNLYSKGRKTDEKWLITLDERHQAHWIAPNGSVWVLVNDQLWARDPVGNLLGQVPLADVLGTADLDTSKTAATDSSVGWTRLRLATNAGKEVRFVFADSRVGSILPIAKEFDGSDLFSEIHREGYGNDPDPEWPLGQDGPIAIWPSYGPGENRLLVQVYERSGDVLRVRSERYVTNRPTQVVKTPDGHILWFQFGGFAESRKALLDVMSLDGKVISTVDLLALGKFGSTDHARAELLLDQLEIRRAGTGSEEVRFDDQTGRHYVVQIKSDEVAARVSLNLDAVSVKEPVFANSKVEGEKTIDSDDGRYQLSVKSVVTGVEKKTQMTLTARIKDPVDGPKSAQLWSLALPFTGASYRVSNSGRVYELLTGPFAGSPKPGVPSLTGILTIEPDGKLLPVFDLVSLKWFSTADEAAKGTDLAKMEIELIGDSKIKEYDGVPVRTWPIEQLTFNFSDGRSESMYLKKEHDFGFPSFMKGKANK